MSYVGLCLATCLVLASCSRDPDGKSLEDRIVWNSKGCAYTLRRNMGDNFFVYRIKDADKETCHKYD